MEKISTPTDVTKRRRERSPAYPGIGLEAAIDRARTLYDREGRHPVHVEVALQDWGYSVKSSGGRTVLAALKQYGLLEEARSGSYRQVRLTDRALNILLDEREGSPEKIEAIQAAALSPKIHEELRSKYDGHIPSDENLRYYLRVERHYTDSAVAEFVPQFRATMEFAGLLKSAILPPRVGDKSSAHNGAQTSDHEAPVTEMVQSTPAPLPAPALHPVQSNLQAPSQRVIQVPLSGSEWVTVQAAFPLSERAWQQMLSVLAAMKPGLTVPSDDAAG